MTCQWLCRMSRNESQPCALPNMLGRLREYAQNPKSAMALPFCR